MNSPETNNKNIQFSEIILGVVCPMANERSSAVEFVNAVLQQCIGFKSVKTARSIYSETCKTHNRNYKRYGPLRTNVSSMPTHGDTAKPSRPAATGYWKSTPASVINPAKSRNSSIKWPRGTIVFSAAVFAKAVNSPMRQ